MNRLHQILGYAGIFPFFIFSLVYFFSNKEEYSLLLLVAYSGLIFSFLGGLLWATTFDYEPPKHVLYVSVGTILWSFVWIISCRIPEQFYPFLFVIISSSFIALHCYERIYLSTIYSKTFLRLRMYLSLSVTSILLLVAFI